MRGLLIALIAGFVSACNVMQPPENIYNLTQEEVAQLQLEYYSDYFSFVGRDDQGMVAFALDNNRGRDQDQWQADHLAVLYEEGKGWRELSGNGKYENADQILETIPNSEHFSFEGQVTDGIVIKSEANGVELTIDPLTADYRKEKGLAKFDMGASAAKLTVEGREIQGRVIYERLYLPGFNRLSRHYLGVFKDFQGIYAAVEGAGDLYLHQQASTFLEPLVGRQSGFLIKDNTLTPIDNLEINSNRRQLAIGFYLWPAVWQSKFEANSQQYEIELQLSERNEIANWVLGGFSMGVVKGEIKTASGSSPVYGLGELIM